MTRFNDITNNDLDIEEITASSMTLPSDEEVRDAIDRFQDETKSSQL